MAKGVNIQDERDKKVKKKNQARIDESRKTVKRWQKNEKNKKK